MNAKHKAAWIVAAMMTMGCTDAPLVIYSAESGPSMTGGKSDGTSGFYPRPTSVHLSDPSLGPVAPGTIQSQVPNAVAYARYALRVAQRGLLGVSTLDTAEEVAYGWAELASRSMVPQNTGLRYARTTASESQRDELLAELHADAEHATDSTTLTKVQARLADIRAGVRACASDGFSPEDCCVTVGYFAALSRQDNWDEWAAGTLGTGFFTEWSAAVIHREQAEVAQGKKVSVQPFVQLGAKAWLAQCAPVLQRVPTTVDSLKAQYGDYTRQSGWIQELHPVSIAKLAGRRIYRRMLPDGTRISVAESLAADCRVKETEVIVGSPDGPMQFFSYGARDQQAPHGYFPTAIGTEQVKLTPDSCMGCHYTFDERRFNVMAPSHEALGLRLPVRNGQPQWRDDSGCYRPGDTVVWHDAAVREF